MDYLVNIFLVIIIYQLFLFNKVKKDEERATREQLDRIEKRVTVKAKVTDPFRVANKKQTQSTSSKHIIIRKTPDQIRAENYEKIKNEGQTYGHIE